MLSSTSSCRSKRRFYTPEEIREKTHCDCKIPIYEQVAWTPTNPGRRFKGCPTRVRDLDFGVEVIGSELVREEDGLAMSSRNVRLSPQDREQALSISRLLLEAKAAAEKGKLVCSDLRRSIIEKIEAAGGKVDYVEIVDKKCLEAVEEIKNGVVVCVAAWFGKVNVC